jgi:hypothetical protein
VLARCIEQLKHVLNEPILPWAAPASLITSLAENNPVFTD